MVTRLSAPARAGVAVAAVGLSLELIDSVAGAASDYLVSDLGKSASWALASWLILTVLVPPVLIWVYRTWIRPGDAAGRPEQLEWLRLHPGGGLTWPSLATALFIAALAALVGYLNSLAVIVIRYTWQSGPRRHWLGTSWRLDHAVVLAVTKLQLSSTMLFFVLGVMVMGLVLNQLLVIPVGVLAVSVINALTFHLPHLSRERHVPITQFRFFWSTPDRYLLHLGASHVLPGCFAILTVSFIICTLIHACVKGQRGGAYPR